MFAKKESALKSAEEFVNNLKSRKVDKPMTTGDKFNEELAFESFKNYIGSVSCAMSHKRVEQIQQNRRNQQV